MKRARYYACTLNNAEQISLGHVIASPADGRSNVDTMTLVHGGYDTLVRSARNARLHIVTSHKLLVYNRYYTLVHRKI